MEQHLRYQETETPVGRGQGCALARLLAGWDEMSLSPGLADVTVGAEADRLMNVVAGAAPQRVDALLTAQAVRVAQMLRAPLCALYVADPLPGFESVLQPPPPGAAEEVALRLRAASGVPRSEELMQRAVVVPTQGPIRQAFL